MDKEKEPHIRYLNFVNELLGYMEEQRLHVHLNLTHDDTEMYYNEKALTFISIPEMEIDTLYLMIFCVGPVAYISFL